MILALYIHSELIYDKHYTDHERIARIVQEVDTNGQSLSIATVSPALGPLVARNYASLGNYVRYHSVGDSTILRAGTVKRSWDTIYFVDNNVFDIFTHKAVYGTLQNALTDPSSIVVSQSLARVYWGESNPVGKTLEINTSQYQVSAVFEDLPETSHLKYDALLPYDILMASFGRTNADLNPENLLVALGYTYFKAPDGFELHELEQTLNQYYMEIAQDPGKDIGIHITYRVQALADIHFDTGWDYDEPTGNIFYVYGFSAVALFILIVACINYTNLATARATKRAKEVGMRKVIGAGKGQLITQFIGESLLYTAIAFCLALFFIEVLEAFTGISSLLGKQELLGSQQNPTLVLWLGIFSLGLGVISGLYPALYLSSISPMAALTATKRERSSKFSVRELLVFVQFFVSIAVLISTLLMSLQMQYVANKPLGFEKENKISIRLRGADVLAQLPVIKNELLNHPQIIGVAES
jgi:putative ABC transport system permease protein